MLSLPSRNEYKLIVYLNVFFMNILNKQTQIIFFILSGAVTIYFIRNIPLYTHTKQFKQCPLFCISSSTFLTVHSNKNNLQKTYNNKYIQCNISVLFTAVSKTSSICTSSMCIVTTFLDTSSTTL